jgi:hypothetical protein
MSRRDDTTSGWGGARWRPVYLCADGAQVARARGGGGLTGSIGDPGVPARVSGRAAVKLLGRENRKVFHEHRDMPRVFRPSPRPASGLGLDHVVGACCWATAGLVPQPGLHQEGRPR